MDDEVAEHRDFVSIDHITITVQDIDSVKHFYADLLGLRVVTDVSVDGSTTYGGFAVEQGEIVELAAASNNAVYDRPHARRRMVVFERIGGVSLTLITHPGDELEGTPRQAGPARLHPSGLRRSRSGCVRHPDAISGCGTRSSGILPGS